MFSPQSSPSTVLAARGGGGALDHGPSKAKHWGQNIFWSPKEKAGPMDPPHLGPNLRSIFCQVFSPCWIDLALLPLEKSRHHRANQGGMDQGLSCQIRPPHYESGSSGMNQDRDPQDESGLWNREGPWRTSGWPQDEAGHLKMNQDTSGQIRVLWNGSGPCRMNQGCRATQGPSGWIRANGTRVRPTEQIRILQGEQGPLKMNQGPT